MSEIYLALALVATFGAFAVGSLSIAHARSDRRRARETLQEQVKTSSMDLRERQLIGSFASRLFLPVTQSLSGLSRRFTPQDLRRRLNYNLALAGSPAGWDAEKLMAVKIAGGLVGLTLAVMLSRSGQFGARGTILVVLFTAIGFFGPDALLSGRGRKRQEEIRRSLPDTMDLLTISVEAGLSFNAALAQVTKHTPGPLSEEAGRLLREMRLGSSRMDAMRDLGERTSVPEMKSFVLAMVQAETFGVSITKVLRSQARELRVKRRQRAEERAMKIPIKILFPLIFCVMPSLFVVIIGPGVIRIAESILKGI